MQIIPGHKEDSPVTTRLPVVEAAIARLDDGLALRIGIKAPAFLSVSGVERNHSQLRCRRIKYAIDDDGVALHLRALEHVACVVRPRHLEFLNITAVDLF